MRTALPDWPERSRDLGQLLARVALGDRAAFASLYERTSGHLLASVLRINRDRAQAEDILQDVYVNVWRAATSFDATQSQPLTWLTSIARNRAIDSLRQRQARPQIASASSGSDDAEDGEPDPYAGLADEAASPLELLSRAADGRALTTCVDQLSGVQRQSVALAFYEGLSHAEVAAHLSQPLGTVKSWVRRALATLKGCLEAAIQRDGLAR